MTLELVHRCKQWARALSSKSLVFCSDLFRYSTAFYGRIEAHPQPSLKNWTNLSGLSGSGKAAFSRPWAHMTNHLVVSPPGLTEGACSLLQTFFASVTSYLSLIPPMEEASLDVFLRLAWSLNISISIIWRINRSIIQQNKNITILYTFLITLTPLWCVMSIVIFQHLLVKLTPMLKM